MYLLKGGYPSGWPPFNFILKVVDGALKVWSQNKEYVPLFILKI